jgi:PhnB protein
MSESATAPVTHSPKLSAMLSVRDGVRAVEFYMAAFAAEVLFCIEEGSVIAHLSVDGAEFWLADESPEHFNFSPETIGGCSVRMILQVDDPDAIFDRAIAAGASVVWPAMINLTAGAWGGWPIRLGTTGRSASRSELARRTGRLSRCILPRLFRRWPPEAPTAAPAYVQSPPQLRTAPRRRRHWP